MALLLMAMPVEAQKKRSKKKQKPINTLHYLGPYAGGGYSLLWHSIPETQLYGGGAGMLGLQYYLRTPKKRFTFSTSLEAMYLTSILGVKDFNIMGEYYYNDPMNQNLRMDYQLDFSNYRELQRQLSINMPILFGKEFKRSYFGAGLNIRANILGGYNTSALLTTSATDPELIDGLINMPNHNLTNFQQKSTGNLSFGLDVMAMAEVGIVLDDWMPQNSIEYTASDMFTKKGISYRLGLFAECGVLSINNNAHNQPLIHFNKGQLQDDGSTMVAHNDITDITHNSILASEQSIDKGLRSFVVGAKFTVLFQLNKAKYRTKKAKKKTTPTTTKTNKPVIVEETVPFLVFDAETNDAIVTPILVTNLTTNTQTTYTTNEEGEVDIPLKDNGSYVVQVGTPGYMGYHDTLPKTLPEVFQIAMQPIKKNAVIILENLFFDTNKTTIKNASTASMEELYNALKNNPDMKIMIIGHTDNVGTDAYNQQLSEGRAKSVRNEMVKRGIAPERMQWKGMGESQPITTNTTDEGRAKNRRVEIKIL